MRMQRTCCTGLLVVCLISAGCGGEEQSESQAVKGQDARPQDARAKSDARALVTELEACYVDSQDYASCERPTGTRLPIGEAKGQVHLSKASAGGYTVVAHSESGSTFTIVKDASGIERTCEAAGSDQGGTW